jgi:hypothetical protein
MLAHLMSEREAVGGVFLGICRERHRGSLSIECKKSHVGGRDGKRLSSRVLIRDKKQGTWSYRYMYLMVVLVVRVVDVL